MISSDIFNYLNKNSIKTHFIKRINNREQLIKKLKIIPIEVVIRNYAAGSLVKRLNFKRGMKLREPLIELYYKSDSLNDPIISDDHAILLNLAKKQHLNKIKRIGLKINSLLINYFKK